MAISNAPIEMAQTLDSLLGFAPDRKNIAPAGMLVKNHSGIDFAMLAIPADRKNYSFSGNPMHIIYIDHDFNVEDKDYVGRIIYSPLPLSEKMFKITAPETGAGKFVPLSLSKTVPQAVEQYAFSRPHFLETLQNFVLRPAPSLPSQVLARMGFSDWHTRAYVKRVEGWKRILRQSQPESNRGLHSC